MKAIHSFLHRAAILLTSRKAVCIFFTLLLLGGFFLAKDYGISWDEKAMYVLGEEAYEYMTRGEPYPADLGIRFHGAWFEALQHAVQELFQLRFARDIFIMRHALNYLTFWIGLLALYGIALRTFKSRGWALVAVLMLLLSPRQFGHVFFNGRDIPAMAFFSVKMFTLVLFIERPSLKTAILHGLASGMVIAIRVGLLFLPLYTVLFLVITMLLDWIKYRHVNWKRHLTLLGVYALAFCFFTVLFWPLLWEHPILHLIQALQNMLWEQNPPGGFYFGEVIGDLPWHWLPVHIVSKTPLLYVALAAVAVCSLLLAAWKKPLSLCDEHRNTLLFFLWFILPIGAVIILKATMFDEWRHLYFIYPALILLAVSGLYALFHAVEGLSNKAGRILRAGLVAIVAASFLKTSVWMVQNHPLQYVYFSLPSRFIDGKFEMDYWGLSFRQGLEWILANDPADPVSVAVTSSPGWEALNILTQEQRRRILMRKDFDTKYVLDNFRWKQYRHTLLDEHKVHSIYVSGMEVLSIYRNPDWKPEVDRTSPRMEDFEVQMRFNPESKSLWDT